MSHYLKYSVINTRACNTESQGTTFHHCDTNFFQKRGL